MEETDHESYNFQDHSDYISIVIENAIHRSLRVPSIVAQVSGYFPFHYGRQKGLEFSYFSAPTISLIVQLFIGTICPTFCIFNVDLYTQIADRYNWSSTERFAYGMMFNIISISKGITKALSFARRERIITFYERLRSILCHIGKLYAKHVGSRMQKEDLSETVRFIENTLRVKVSSPLRFVWVLLFLLEFMVLLMMSHLLVKYVTESEKEMEQNPKLSLQVVVLYGLAMALCLLSGILYSAILYWLVGVIHCLETAFYILARIVSAARTGRSNEGNCTVNGYKGHSGDTPLVSPGTTVELQNLIDNQITPRIEIPNEIQNLSGDEDLSISDFFTSYSLINGAVKAFNEIFKYHLGLILLGCCTSCILHTFVLISGGLKDGIQLRSTIAHLLWVVLDVATIVIVCNASSRLADAATAATEEMREYIYEQDSIDFIDVLKIQADCGTPIYISPGNYFVLKRSAIISITTVLTTYVFVMLQFQDAEKRGT